MKEDVAVTGIMASLGCLLVLVQFAFYIGVIAAICYGVVWVIGNV